MKIAMFVGLFCLISCVALQANGAVARGKTTDCNKVPEGLEGTCYKYDCDQNSGIYTIYSCGTFTVECPKGTVVETPEDLTKEYPDCCPQPTCRAV